MIASENFVSEAVLDAQGSTLTNKYAEGYPGERYYGGCEYIDRSNSLAIERAKELWGAEYVNVQPHSGSQANMGVYLAALEPGDKILSMDLTHGGHLSHGHKMNFAGKIYEVEHYEVDPDTGRSRLRRAMTHTPKSSTPTSSFPATRPTHGEVDWERIQETAETADAYQLADIAHITGLVATGEHPSPVGIADFVTGSTHKTIRSGRGGIIMCDEEYADAVDSAIIPGMQGGPLMHNIAGKAVGFEEALEPEFEEYAAQTVENAKVARGDRFRNTASASSPAGRTPTSCSSTCANPTRT